MESSLKFLDPRTLAKLQGLTLRARRIVEGFVAGLHRSPYRGFSVEFAEHREYVPGDDIRYLDWKVFGRTDKFYLKQYEDETNLICYLALDVSESMSYRGPDSALSKLEYAQCIAAALAWLVLQRQDAVGLITFDSQIRDYVPPSNSPARLSELLTVMEQTPSANKTAISNTFRQLAQKLTKRGVVLVISDLFDDAANVLMGLRHLRHRQHDLAVLQILDPAELSLPFDRPTLFRGLEGLPELTTQPRAIRAAYRAELDAFLQQLKRGCSDNEIDYRLISTAQSFDVALSAFVSSRRRVR
ncbi:MAG: DUF58 domain-containing protein [Planctomycetales bacterium]|nr:DUF58 domain-containing protein [Planctomycetales bacterium]